MARGNRIGLCGMVSDLPKIMYDDQTHKYQLGLGSVKVIRGTRDAGDGKRYETYSYPVIYSRNEEFIKEMETWKLNDIVSIEGVIATSQRYKSSVCPHCKAKNRKMGDFTYVEPIYIKTERSFGEGEDAENQAKEELKSRITVSNRVMVSGNLGRNPVKMTLKNKRGKEIRLCQYPIVINRTLFVPEDPADKTNDFPWVKSYGKNGEADYYRLHSGSTVVIDGFLQTRHVLRHDVCDVCGEKYDWKDDTMEIVPYNTEYMMNCRTEEEAIAEQARRTEQSVQDTLRDLRAKMGVKDPEDSRPELYMNGEEVVDELAEHAEA